MRAPSVDTVHDLMPSLKGDLARLVAIPSISEWGFPEHTRPPLLEAHAANATIRVTDAGMMPGKASDTQRIDALSATLTALAHVIATPPEPPSVYDTRGLLVV